MALNKAGAAVVGSTPDDLRAAALALPEAVEQDHFGSPSFRVNGKIFAQIAVREPGKALLKLPRARREWLWEVRPEVFAQSVWGKIISCFVSLDGVEPVELAELVETSWREVAPKRLTSAPRSPSLPPSA